MAYGHYQGMDVHAPQIRAMFTREALLASDWYRQRLQVKRARDLAMWRRNLDELLRFQQNPHNVDEARRLDRLTADLGLLSRLDEGTLTLNRRRVDLGQVAERVVR